MVRIYVNGKQVTKEELSKYEIHNKAVKRILSEANANDLIGAKHLDPYTGFPGYKSAGCNMRKVQKEN